MFPWQAEVQTESSGNCRPRAVLSATLDGHLTIFRYQVQQRSRRPASPAPGCLSRFGLLRLPWILFPGLVARRKAPAEQHKNTETSQKQLQVARRQLDFFALGL